MYFIERYENKLKLKIEIEIEMSTSNPYEIFSSFKLNYSF